MPDFKSCSHGSQNTGGCRECLRECVAIDTNRILDSCRDKDCFEDVRVYLTDCGQEIIDKTSTVRVKSTKVLWSCINVDPVAFNRGFYQIHLRLYTKITFEGCVSPGRAQEFEGIAVTEKRIILYGSEGNVSIFRSNPGDNNFCCVPTYDGEIATNAPTVVCEVVDPIALSVRVSDEKKCCCCCCVEDIPDEISCCVNGSICGDDFDGKRLYVTLGFFSVVRIERPAQLMIQASEYSVPDKQCIETNDEDPCAAFNKMSFPVNEFAPPSFRDLNCD